MKMLDISHYVLRTKVLGPYIRSALWVHGCNAHCQGCIAKEMNMQSPDFKDTDSLASIFAGTYGTEGITISGGEPFLQAAALCRMIETIKDLRDYGVIIYTGNTYEELKGTSDKNIGRLLRYTDILIDGRYIEALDDGKAYRGSSNQRILKLTDRYDDIFETYYCDNDKRNIEIDVAHDKVYLVGVPSKYGLETWEKFKKKAGCESD